MELTLFLPAKNTVLHMVSHDLKMFRQECHTHFIEFFNMTIFL
jgi:hypothetical protein